MPLPDPSLIDETASTPDETVLRVSNTTDVKQLAASISFALQDSRRVTLRAVGAAAVSQMAKAAAIARTYVAPRGVDLVVRPGFQTIMLPSLDPKKQGSLEETTAVIFVCKVE